MRRAGSKYEWSARWPIVIGCITIIALVGGFGSWAAASRIAGAIVAPGQIEIEQNRQVIQHRDGGVIASIAVREGDHVAQGQVLMHLDATQMKAQLAAAETQFFEITARINRLTAERDDLNALPDHSILRDAVRSHPEVRPIIEGQQRLFDTRVQAHSRAIDQLARRKLQIADQITGIRAQDDALVTQVNLLSQELETQESLLQRGLAQSNRVLALKREQARLNGRLGELAAQIAENEGRRTEIDLEILRLGIQRKEDAITQLRDLSFRQFELASEITALSEGLESLAIVAPVGGLVFDLNVFAERTVIRPAEPLMFIVPDNRPMIVKVKIDPPDIDEVKIGQTVMLRFSALDAAFVPELEGRVRKLSGDVFSDELTGRTYYRAEVEIARSPGPDTDMIQLIPGMPVDVFIQTEERSPLDYLLNPITAYFSRAFRET